jgi:hypothetical protein
MAEKFDRFRKPTERPCQCGKGCGLTFTLRPGSGRTRRYAPGCPHAAQKQREAALAYYHRNRARILLEKANQPRNVRPKSTDGRATVKWCKECGGLPHRRPESGCPVCLLPYAPDTYETKGGQTIVVAP